mgnify:CR=1 FL=1
MCCAKPYCGCTSCSWRHKRSRCTLAMIDAAEIERRETGTAAEIGDAPALRFGTWLPLRFDAPPGRGIEEGAPADLVVYPADPLADLGILRSPSRIVLRGRVVA